MFMELLFCLAFQSVSLTWKKKLHATKKKAKPPNISCSKPRQAYWGGDIWAGLCYALWWCFRGILGWDSPKNRTTPLRSIKFIIYQVGQAEQVGCDFYDKVSAAWLLSFTQISHSPSCPHWTQGQECPSHCWMCPFLGCCPPSALWAWTPTWHLCRDNPTRVPFFPI